MEKELVLKIIGALAAGIDPVAGEVVPHDHVLQQPDVIRALHEAFAAVQRKRVPRPSETAPAKRAPRQASSPAAPAGQGVQIPIPMRDVSQTRATTENRESTQSAPRNEPVNRPSFTARVGRLVANARASLLGPSDPAAKRRRKSQQTKRWTREDALEAKRAFLAGETVTGIAKRLGHERAGVLSLFKFMDLISDEQEAKGIESYPRHQLARKSA